jgi:hypothetical protein
MGLSTARLPARKGQAGGGTSAEKTSAPSTAEAWVATPTNIFWSFVAGALAYLRPSAGKPRERPLARIMSRHAALGFSYRRCPPTTVPTKPERVCDCVPWSW